MLRSATDGLRDSRWTRSRAAAHGRKRPPGCYTDQRPLLTHNGLSVFFPLEKQLDADRLNRWLTLSANIAVVAGIFFLGLELRQNNELLQFEAGSVYFQNRVWGVNKSIENPEFARMIFKARNGEELDDFETYQVRQFYRRIFLGINWEYSQAKDGRLELSRHERWHEIVKENRYAVAEWEWAVENVLTPDFVQYMSN